MAKRGPKRDRPPRRRRPAGDWRHPIARVEVDGELMEFDVYRVMWSIGSGAKSGDEAQVLAGLVAQVLNSDDPTEAAAFFRELGEDPLGASDTYTADEVTTAAQEAVKLGFLGPTGPTTPG
jgi:hypothetical protein